MLHQQEEGINIGEFDIFLATESDGFFHDHLVPTWCLQNRVDGHGVRLAWLVFGDEVVW